MKSKILKGVGKRLVYSIVLVCLLFSVINPVPAHAAPPPPTDSEPSIEPQGQSTTPTRPTPSAPTAGAFDEGRAKMAMEIALAKYLETLGPRYAASDIEVSLDGDWAVGTANWTSEEEAFEGPVNILAQRQPDGTWTAMLPEETDEFKELIYAAPLRLITDEKKNALLSRAAVLDTFSFHSSLDTLQTASYPIATSFRFPLDGSWNVSLDFGGSNENFSGKHLGEDVYGDSGTPVYATAIGEVRDNTLHTKYGYVVVIEHTLPNGEKVCSVYGHLRQEGIISLNSIVNKGDVIGYLGTSSQNGGYVPHLHFGIRNGAFTWWVYYGYDPGGQYQYWNDPTDFINSHQSSLCSSPLLTSPNENYVSPGNTITFVWNQTVCSGQNGYYFRVGTSPNGSDVVSDYSVQGLQTNYSFGSQWYNRDLYWSVRANASGAEWSSSRRFRIEQSQPPTSCSSYITNFGFSPETPSNATNISVHATISTSFPNFRAARLRVDGGNPFCEGTSYSYSCSNWETRNLLDGDHTVVLEVDDNIGSSWDSPATCSRTYHLDPRPTPPPSAFNLISPGNGVTLSQTQQITLTWQNSDGANEYQAHLWNGSSVDRYSSWSSGTSWIAGQLSPGTYYWRVTARNAYGTTESTQWTFSIQQNAPNTPTNLSAARISQSQINLSWIDNSDNETGFRLYREGLLIATLGANENYYEDTGLNCGTGYNYYVVAFNTYESGHSNTASATTMDCTPVDTEKPVVNWTGPVSNEQTHHVSNETVELTVSAMDNVGVSRVHYSRWDAVNLVTIDIGDSYSSPYGFLLDCSTLNLNWNQINARAYDAAGNVSDLKFIWLYRHAPQPDLLPLAPSGYYAPIVPASVTGTHTPNQLYAGQITYFDWQFANDGWATAPGTFYVELWVDDTQYIRYPEPDFAPKQPGGDDDWAITIDSPGWHRVRLIVDSENTVSESDETNNIWEEWFYWNPSAPMIDDMESEINGWTATGLWHHVTDSSAYMNRTSGVGSWWYGQEETGDYDTGAVNSGDLTSPPIYLPASEHFYLRFKYWYVTETKSYLWDQRWIQISVDGGGFQNFAQLHDDNMDVWHNSPIIDLGAFSGHTIQVRFHFDTLDAMENAYRGWYIDDLEILTDIMPSCADAHEGNNDISNATPISYGGTLYADICANGDYDYYRFTAQSGDEITVDIDASVNGSILDTFITLLDSSGEVVSTNDDDGMTYDSKLGYTINTTGIYYIRVRDYWHPSNGGQDYYYSIKLFSDPDDPTSAAITSPTSEDWINPTSQQVTVVASDAGSGISRVEFLWHSADWINTDWIWLGADTNASDGWSYSLDTSVLEDQRGGAIYIWAFDYAENYLGTGIWDLGIDRTPPTTWMDSSAMYGDAPFRDFHVWWGGSDNLSGIVGYDFQVRDGLTGEWDDIDSNITDTYTRFVGTDGHTYYFQVRARDAAGNVSDYIGGDGQTVFTVQLCNVSADSFEDDNSAMTANTLLLGDTQSHNFHSERDADWVKFTVEGGKEYIISTVNTGSHADTELTLYDMDGVTTIQSNDDYDGSNYASMIRWQPAQSGTYYALVNHWDVYGYGCTTHYAVSIEDSTNVTPVITTLTPESAPNGSASFTLVINGINFSSDARVLWNDNELTTSFISNTQLTVSVPANLLTDPGTIDIVVRNPGLGGITSNTVNFTVEGDKLLFLPLVVRQ